MNDEELPAFDWDEGIPAEGAPEDHAFFDRIGVRKETITTDLAEKLAFITVVLVEIDHGSATPWTTDVFRNVTGLTTLDRLKNFIILPAIVFQEIFPVPVLCGRADIAKNRRFVHSVFLILRRVGIIECPLLERDISADKRYQPAILLIKVLTQLKKIGYNVHEQYISFCVMLFWSMTLYQKKGGIALFICKRTKIPSKQRISRGDSREEVDTTFAKGGTKE